MDMSTPFTVPWITVPFLSSTVTVSLLRRCKNLCISNMCRVSYNLGLEMLKWGQILLPLRLAVDDAGQDNYQFGIILSTRIQQVTTKHNIPI
jgi:hypothetical protein